jgi:hypothetical protein
MNTSKRFDFIRFIFKGFESLFFKLLLEIFTPFEVFLFLLLDAIMLDPVSFLLFLIHVEVFLV